MTTRRDGGSATLPDNGPVLMADCAGATAAAEPYNPGGQEGSPPPAASPRVRDVHPPERRHDLSAAPW